MASRAQRGGVIPRLPCTSASGAWSRRWSGAGAATSGLASATDGVRRSIAPANPRHRASIPAARYESVELADDPGRRLALISPASRQLAHLPLRAADPQRARCDRGTSHGVDGLRSELLAPKLPAARPALPSSLLFSSSSRSRLPLPIADRGQLVMDNETYEMKPTASVQEKDYGARAYPPEGGATRSQTTRVRVRWMLREAMPWELC